MLRHASFADHRPARCDELLSGVQRGASVLPSRAVLGSKARCEWSSKGDVLTVVFEHGHTARYDLITLRAKTNT